MAKKPILRVGSSVKEGEFLGVEVPHLDWIKVDLTYTQRNSIDTKTEELNKVENNYTIQFSVFDKVPQEDKDLTSKIQEICGLRFPNYYWREKQYRFYTTDYTGSDERKKEILINLFNYLKNYEIEKTNQLKDSTETFKEDMLRGIKVESADLIMKFHNQTQRFVVLAKSFLGGDKFTFLRRHSEYAGKLVDPIEITESNENKYLIDKTFFAEDMKNKKIDKNFYFIIHPGLYEDVKMHFNMEEKKQNEFIEQQKKVSAENDLSQYNVEIENVFGLKIKFVPEIQCFEFYGKGYDDPSSFMGHAPNRGLIPLWALNFVYSKEKQPNEDGTYGSYSYDLNASKEKIELMVVPGGSKRDKNTRIPAIEWNKLKEIKENFEKENKFWSRPEKAIKITHCQLNSDGIFSRYPAVYFDGKGNSFLSYSCRATGMFKMIGQNSFGIDYNAIANESDKKEKKFSQTIKSIPISFEEANYFLEKHLFSEQIKRGSIVLNGRIHAPADNQYISDEEAQKIYETSYLVTKMHSEAKKNNVGIVQKSKRVKL
jgi:hypothetical protein